MLAPGHILTLPPTPINSRFILLEETTKTFYDIDTVTEKLGNPASWATTGLSPSLLGGDLAIVIPTRLNAYWKARLGDWGREEPKFKSVECETGLLVVVTKREGDRIYADIKGQVNIHPLQDAIMNWDVFADRKGQVMADELENGLLERVYGGLQGADQFIHPAVLARMPRQWHIDASVMNDELSHIFASGRAVRKGDIKWTLREGRSGDEQHGEEREYWDEDEDESEDEQENEDPSATSGGAALP